MKNNEDYATFSCPTELRIVRTLPGPIERVWDYLMDPQKRARWFCGGELQQKVGGKIVFHMVHKNLAPHEKPPAKYEQVQDPGVSFEGRILKFEAPRLISYTFGSDDSEVTIEKELTNYASGWHIHLDHLVAQLTNTPRPGFWSLHDTLIAEYEKRRAAELQL
jgi:uncharacterized protein YndB with AHSA1/START domain